jgi:DNA helicase-2/ATP-dependent DNA helicase PcrA
MITNPTDFSETGFRPTEEQQKVLDLKTGLNLVLAPPGSGKTELLAQRVYDAKNNGYEDSDIICLTFTNRAAKGMKERIDRKYPDNRITIGNFHRYAVNFLKANRFIPLNANILDEEDQNQIIEEIKEELKYGYDAFGKKISNYVYNPELIKLAVYLKQKELGFPEDLFNKPRRSDIPDVWKAKEVGEAYNKEKQESNYFDFDDLLTMTYYHLSRSDRSKLLLGQFRWIQVDEVQDLNPLQWAILHRITAPDALEVYFGDYEQAIFSFMGAKLESFHNIEQQINADKQKNSILNLCKNFRSPSYLMDIYVRYAETHWRPSWKQRPFAHKQQEAPAGALRIFRINGTNSAEAEYIAANILPPMLVNGERTAIIVKENRPADIISDALKRKNLPHFKISGFDLFHRKPIKGLMAFMSVLHNEFDRLSWARIFHEFASLSLKESRVLVNDIFRKGLTPVDILIGASSAFTARTGQFFDIFSNQTMVVFDTETTGLDTATDDIIQIAAVKIKNGRTESVFEVYIKTDKDISLSEAVHNISKEYLNKNGLSAREGLEQFMTFCGENCVLVAHNIRYDYNILNSNLSRYCNRQLTDWCSRSFDSILITKLLYPDFTSYKLKNLIERLNIKGVNSHNALDDVKATVALIDKLNSDYRRNFQTAQSRILNDAENIKIFRRLIHNFNPLFVEIQETINTCGQLKKLIERYFEYAKITNEELHELEKLTKHLDHYTNLDSQLTLREKIDRYLPEYILYKESDLYLGHEQIVVSTVYKAKGLEFDNVVIADATDEMYPRLWALKKDLQNAETQEKRKNIQTQITKKTLEDARAFYVAMTRSKKKLYITIPTNNSFGYRQAPSGFINCIQGYFEQINT